MLKGQLDAATLFLLCQVMIETPPPQIGPPRPTALLSLTASPQ